MNLLFTMPTKKASEATAEAIIFGLAMSQFVLEGEAAISENLLQVGAPIAFGALAVNYVYPKWTGGGDTPMDYLKTGVLAGAVGTGVMMAAGALPVAFDVPTLGFAGLVGLSVVVGQMASSAINWSS